MYRRPKRTIPEINASSTADIAFLLLIFFLMTTSMDTDRGVTRQLPPLPVDAQEPKEMKLKERNVLRIELNAEDELMCAGEKISLSEIRQRAKRFISNPTDEKELPEKSPVDIPYLGSMLVTQNHIISFQCSRASSYKTYIAVQNELVAAYNELRDELAWHTWHCSYADLSSEQKRAVRMVYPQRISEQSLRHEEGGGDGTI